jgi:large subunit ribosomal protein L23
MERLSDKLNQYGFIVEEKANRLEIKKAVEELYGVTVNSINTIRYAGKLKSRYTRSGYLSGRTNSFKKAIVTLKEGEKIDFYSNI